MCDVFCKVPCPFVLSLLKKKILFSSLLPKFLSLASSAPRRRRRRRPLLSKRPERKKNISLEEARAFRSHEAVSSHHHARQKALCCKLSSYSAGVFFLLLSSARVYSSLYAEREREREREKSGVRRGGVERGKFHFLQKICSFPSPKLQVPPSKGKRKKKRRDSK